MGIWRRNKKQQLTAILSETAADLAAGDASADAIIESIGIEAKALSEDERKEANVSRGVLIVKSFGSAQKAGIMPGDILLSVNDLRIEDIEGLRTAVTDNGSTMALLIQRGDSRTYIPVVID